MQRKKRLPKSIRKYIRQEKAYQRREFLDLEKQKEQMEDLYKRISDTCQRKDKRVY